MDSDKARPYLKVHILLSSADPWHIVSQLVRTASTYLQLSTIRNIPVALLKAMCTSSIYVAGMD